MSTCLRLFKKIRQVFGQVKKNFLTFLLNMVNHKMLQK